MSFGNTMPSHSGAGSANAGPDLAFVETEQLAFRSASGKARIQLLPSPWPSDRLPTKTSSLLSVASNKGLVAAAGPDVLVVASTESLRQTASEAQTAGVDDKSFSPQASIPIPRVSQVHFSSDESCLVIAAEEGGGLAVYDTNALSSGAKEPAFQLATNGKNIRELLPNPSADLSRLFGVVTEEGQLLLADLKERKLVTGANGSTVLQEQVSCACWSRLGKQIVAGLASGRAAQVDQSGVVKAEIPEPPQLAELKDSASIAYPITTISWLETNDFLIIHTPVNHADSGAQDDSIYHFAHRDKQSQVWTFSRFLDDPCPPFGLDRKPASHFVQRLREWAPSLSDLLVLSSTASDDVGLFTRSKKALNPDTPITDAFAVTSLPDQQRPTLPEAMDQAGVTSPIGMAIDLSAKEKILKPISTDETLDESPVLLPALYILNNEGMLRICWVVYNDSIRQSQPYSGLVNAGTANTQTQAPSTSLQSQPASSSPFGNAGSGPAAPAQAPSFGQPGAGGNPAAPAFGAPSLGSKPSPWGTPGAAATGGSRFGQPSFGGSGFGHASGLGAKPSVWGSQPATQPSTTSVGSAFGGNASQQSPFAAKTAPSASPFAANSKATASPFASAGGQNANSVPCTSSPFASAGDKNANNTSGASAFGSMGGQPSNTGSTPSPFGGLGGQNGSKAPAASPFAAAPANNSSNAKPLDSPFNSFNARQDSQQKTSSFSSFGGVKENQQSPFGSKPSLPQDPSGSTVSFSSGLSFGSGGTAFGGGQTPSLAATGSSFGKRSGQQGNEESTGRGAEENNSTPSFGFPSGGLKLGNDPPKSKESGGSFFGSSFSNALEDAGKKPQQPATPIKEEPDANAGPKFSDIPEASTTPKSPPKPESPEPEEDSNDVPLPPDPRTYKPKPGALPPPLPPGFKAEDLAASKDKQTDDTGKNKNFAASSAFANDNSDMARNQPPSLFSNVTKKEQDAPVAGSPPVDLAEAGPPDDSDDEEWEGIENGQDGGGKERDDSDEAEDESSPGHSDEDDSGSERSDEQEPDSDQSPKIEDAKGLSAFEKRIAPASPKRDQQPQSPEQKGDNERHESATPATAKKTSYTPAGLPKAPVVFHPPHHSVRESPRSPSPVRSATSPVRPLSSNFNQTPPSTQQPPRQPPRQPSSSQQHRSRIAVPTDQLKPLPSPKRQVEFASEPVELALVDEEADEVHKLLATEVEPTTEVPHFLAHQDYDTERQAGEGEKEQMGGQIERVYRDINSMIDTVALNARSIKSFVAGHQEGKEQRAQDDLEDNSTWTLGESQSLAGILEELEHRLESGRIKDPRPAIADVQDLDSDLTRQRARFADMRKAIRAVTDSNELASHHSAPLPLDAAAQQSELRSAVTRVQTLLGHTEQALSELRADLTSMPSSGQQMRPAPTMEAVTNTILKMTAMVEQRSGDVDVLEAQIRKLGGLPSQKQLQSGYEDDLVAGMKASRLGQSFSSPSGGLRGSRLGMSASRGSPALGGSLGASGRRSARGTPWAARKSLLDVSEEEVEQYRAKKEGRRKAVERLRARVEDKGARTVKA